MSTFISRSNLLAACSSVEATLKLHVGTVQTDKGTDRKLFASIRMGEMTHDEKTAGEAERIVLLLARLSKLRSVGITLPVLTNDVALSVALRSRMEGDVAAYAFAVAGGHDVPKGISAERITFARVALQLDELPKKERKSKTAVAVNDFAETASV